MAKTNAEKMAKAEKALTELAESLGLEYIDYELKKESGALYLRLTVDKDGGLTLDDCEKFHKRAVGLVEDVEYDFLECSSPGLERPLKKERDFLKYMGKEVEVRLFKQVEGKKIFTGVLSKYENGAIEIDTGEGARAFDLKETALVKPVIDYTAELAKGEEN